LRAIVQTAESSVDFLTGGAAGNSRRETAASAPQARAIAYERVETLILATYHPAALAFSANANP
jgi:hypothetical protein